MLGRQKSESAKNDDFDMKRLKESLDMSDPPKTASTEEILSKHGSSSSNSINLIYAFYNYQIRYYFVFMIVAGMLLSEGKGRSAKLLFGTKDLTIIWSVLFIAWILTCIPTWIACKEASRRSRVLMRGFLILMTLIFVDMAMMPAYGYTHGFEFLYRMLNGMLFPK